MVRQYPNICLLDVEVAERTPLGGDKGITTNDLYPCYPPFTGLGESLQIGLLTADPTG